VKLLNRVLREIDRGASIAEIKENFGISNKSLARCQTEVEVRNNIKRLIQEGRLDEAEIEAGKLNDDVIDTETLFILQELASKTKNAEREKEVLAMIGKRQLNNSQKRKILYDSLKLEPENLKTIRELIRLLYRIDEKEEARRLERVARTIRKRQVEAEAREKEEPKDPVEIARNIIYEEQDVLKSAEDINRILEGENEQERAIVLAEFFAHTGLKRRAESVLSVYKKALNVETQREEIKTINQAIALVKSTKTKQFNWTYFWEQKRELSIQEVKEHEEEGR
jgi:AraC-like DNA-binding protein